jgi:hypothetical protein
LSYAVAKNTGNDITDSRGEKKRKRHVCMYIHMCSYLKLADLSVQWKGVEQHGTDEGDVSGLAERKEEIFLRSRTDVMIFKIFLQKTLAFFAQNKAKLCQSLIIYNIGLEKNAIFFSENCRKWQKNFGS